MQEKAGFFTECIGLRKKEAQAFAAQNLPNA
jgi:hypothetical protein